MSQSIRIHEGMQPAWDHKHHCGSNSTCVVQQLSHLWEMQSGASFQVDKPHRHVCFASSYWSPKIEVSKPLMPKICIWKGGGINSMGISMCMGCTITASVICIQSVKSFLQCTYQYNDIGMCQIIDNTTVTIINNLVLTSGYS